jgi:transcriptional regulator with XRE-family HTH domain
VSVLRRKTELGKFLKSLCVERDMTMKQMAKKLGYSYQFLWMVMSGERIANEKFVNNVVKKFNLNEDERLKLIYHSMHTYNTMHLNLTQLTDDKKMLVLKIKNKLPTLTEEQTKQIRKVLDAS